MPRFIIVACLTAFLATSPPFVQLMEDVVHVKNGSVVLGNIIEQLPGQSLKITTGTASPLTNHTGDYDTDDDGLIDVSNLRQLNAIRWDLDGDGASSNTDYAIAFPDASSGMGCPASVCIGYELTADLDFDSNGNGRPDEGDAFWNNGSGWLPIGNRSDPFAATFDGNGYTISNLYINGRTGTGLFSVTHSNSVIKRAGLVSATVAGSGYGNGGVLVGENNGAIANSFTDGIVGGCFDNIGGLVGTNAGIIDSSHSTGGVLSARGTGGGGLRDLFEDLTGIYIGGSSRTCYTDGGGLVGQNYGTITASHSASDVSGHSDNFGGLVGANRGGTITDSYATGPVSGNGYADVGGLVGDNDAGSIVASHATGAVSGQGDLFGGLAGRNSGVIVASYATGNVSGNGYSRVGGLVGGNDSNGSITATYATGEVSGRGDFFGGLVGRNSGSITASYAIGRVSGNGGTDGSGLLDANRDGGVVSDSYWDTQTTGRVSSEGGIGKTTHELQSPTGYAGIYANWKVDLNGDGSADDPWDFGTSSQYPVLKYNPPRPPWLTASVSQALAEATLDGSLVTLTLITGAFVQLVSNIRDAVTVSGIAGVAFNVKRVNDTAVAVELEFNGNIDTDGMLTVEVGAGAIAEYNGPALTAQIPVIMTRSVAASTVSPLTEATLDGSVVALTLSGGAYDINWNYVSRNVSVSGIAGVTFRRHNVVRVSDTKVTVELEFNGNIDADGTLTFTVGADAIAGYNGPSLTAQIPVTVNAPGATSAMTDFNGDDRTDFADFFLFADAYGGTDSRFDLDGSGTVDFADFFKFVDAFGS